MAYYETTFIARQDLSTAQVEALATEFAGIVEANGGKAVKTEYCGLRALAYKIRKNRKGHYIHYNFDAPVEAIAEMERLMRLNEDILRYLNVKIESLSEEPSLLMKQKDQRPAPRRDDGDRPRRARFEDSRKTGDVTQAINIANEKTVEASTEEKEIA